MRVTVIRYIILLLALLVGGIGIYLLLPFLEGSETYTHPKKAFYGAIFFIAWGGFVLALASVGFKKSKDSKDLISLKK